MEESLAPSSHSSLSTGRTHRDLGRHSACIAVVILNIIELILLSLTFVFPVFQRIPYKDYTINYFFTKAEIDESESFGGDSFDFDECNKDPSHKQCTTLYNTGLASRNLQAAATVFLCLISILLMQRVCKRYPRFSNHFIGFILFFMLLIYILSLSSLIQFTTNWPYTIFCAYGGDDTGCNWYMGITLLIGSMTVNIISIVILISMLTPLCILFCPCLKPNESKQPIYNRNRTRSVDSNDNKNNDNDSGNDSDNDDDEKLDVLPNGTTPNNNINIVNPDRRRRMGCFISLPEWLSMLSLTAIFAFSNLVLCFLLTDKWQQAIGGSQEYIDNQWENAECLEMDGYEEIPSIVTRNDSLSDCAFSFPNDDDNDYNYNGSWWTCCGNNTCNIAFNYTNLFYDYKKYDYQGQCMTDMKALTKASCHPKNKWFTGSLYNISLSPRQRLSITNNTLTEDNTIALCSIFCSEIWDHCLNLPMTHQGNTTIRDNFHDAQQFCYDGLAMLIRKETFTDECFAGCSRLSVFSILSFITSVTFIRIIDSL